MKVDALPEPLSAGLVYLVPSSQPQQGEKAVIWVVGILNDSPSLILASCKCPLGRFRAPPIDNDVQVFLREKFPKPFTVFECIQCNLLLLAKCKQYVIFIIKS